MRDLVKLTPLVILVLLSLGGFSSSVFAESWWQKAKDVVHEISEEVEQTFSTDESAIQEYETPHFDPTDPLVLAAKAQGWSLRYQQDVLWHSPIAVLEAGNVNAPSVVLVHGLGQNGMLDWLPVIPALAQRYHVLALDLPGFGRSGLPQGKYSPAHYATVVEGLIREFAHEEVYLVGHSMGAAVSLYLASQKASADALQGKHLRQLILIDAAGILDRTAFVKSLATASLSLEKLPDIIRSPSASAVDFAESLIERVSLLGDPTAVLANSAIRNAIVGQSPNSNAALALVQTNYSGRLAQVNVPTAILWGANDTVAPLRTGYLLEQQIPTASLSILPDAGHVPMSSHVEIFNQWLLGKLDGNTKDNFIYERPLDLIAKSDLSLKNCSNQVITGSYKHITLNNCKNILLDSVDAESLSVSHSLVELRNVNLVSEGRSFSSHEAVVLGTNVIIRGKKAALINGSRIDFAGASIRGADKALKIKAKSLLVFSVSELQSGEQRKLVHGSFRFEDKLW